MLKMNTNWSRLQDMTFIQASAQGAHICR